MIQSLLTMFWKVLKKGSFLHFKHYNLAIHMVNFLLQGFAHYFSSLSQDPMVGSLKLNEVQFRQCTLKVIVLEF
jgi:hypothetical protein